MHICIRRICSRFDQNDRGLMDRAYDGHYSGNFQTIITSMVLMVSSKW